MDALEAKGIPCLGPRANAAIIEGSKVFSKNLMKKYGIPTATYEVFTDMEPALAYAETCPIPTVIKADGLALGKMGHSERIGNNLYRNVPGEYDIRLFRNAVKYFK